MTSTLSPADIRTMDGKALTELAWELGLAPVGTETLCNGNLRVPIVGLNGLSESWNPAENLAQADAVFRSLRARGWITTVSGEDGKEGRLGRVIAQRHGRYGAQQIVLRYWPQDAPTEAHAMLLVSVLAVASEDEYTPEPKERS